jgi:phenylalanyl-tRNA synthetase alpha chain
MNDDILNLKNEAIAQITSVKDAAELENLRIAYLGKSGKITTLIKQIKDVPQDRRIQFGKNINEAKSIIVDSLMSQKNKFSTVSREWFDPTIPGITPREGHLHLVTQAIDEITNVFNRIGFYRMRYPEVEWDYFAFGALNFPENHPARDDWETFFVDCPKSHKFGPMVLTPHTSSG